MLHTIINMPSVFKLVTVAEGVETEEQFNYLVEKECDIFQGFYFFRPVVKAKLEKYYNELNSK